MPSTALQATITAALAPIVGAVFLLIHVPESKADQAVIVLGASALVAVVFGVYSAITTHTVGKVSVAKEGTIQAQHYAGSQHSISATIDTGLERRVEAVECDVKALKSLPAASTSSGAGATFTGVLVGPKAAPRKRPSRAKAPAAAKK